MARDTVGRTALVALVAANAVSLLGNVAAAIAVPWFALITTGSVARTGVAAFFTTLPLALGAFFGGAVADRVGHRRASIVSDLASAGAIAAIPLLFAFGELDFTRLVALAFVGSLFDAPGQAAREALLPEAAGRAGVPLERATALWTSTEHAGYVLGAPAAGVLIATIGAPNALWLDAGSFLASAALVAAFAPALRPRAGHAVYLHELAEGLRFVLRDRVLLTFLSIATVGNFLIAPVGPVLLPVYAHERLGGASSLAVLTAAYGLGGLIGAGGFAVASLRVSRRFLYVLVWAAYPILSFALVALPGLRLAAATLFGIGLVAGTIGPLEQLVRQERTPAKLRARVFATFMASLTLAVPPAVLLAGIVVDAAGIRAGFAAVAAGNALLTAAALTLPATRELGR